MQNWFAKHAVKITAGLRLTFGAMVLAAVFLVGAIFHQVGGSFSRLFLFLATDGTTVTVIAGLLVTPLFALAYATFKRAHKRDAIQRSLGKELQSIRAYAELRVHAAENFTLTRPASFAIGVREKARERRDTLRRYASTGTTFRATAPADLGLLTDDAVESLFEFHDLNDFSISMIDTIDTVDPPQTFLAAARLAVKHGRQAAQALGINPDDKL